jgi:probable blue pigment (indigoidine) exporter
VPPLVWGALMIVTIGVALAANVFEAEGRIEALGLAGALGQAVMFAIYVIATERITTSGHHGFVLTGWTLVGAFAVITPFMLADGLSTPTDGRGWAELGVFMLVPTVLATATFYQAARSLDPTGVAMVLTVEVVIVTVLSALLFDDRLVVWQYVGTALVVGGVLVAQWSERRKPVEHLHDVPLGPRRGPLEAIEGEPADVN